MTEIDTSFRGDIAHDFVDYSETVRGRIRYECVRQNLTPLVCGRMLEVADIGGGTAIDAVWLAGLGHRVTIVEPAEDQCRLAQERIEAVGEDIAGRITVLHGTAANILPDAVVSDEPQQGDGQFDLVLSHGVAMYVPDPEAFVHDLVRLTRPYGHISLLEKGRLGAQLALEHAGRTEDARSLEMTHRFRNNLGREVWAFSPEELEHMLVTAGIWSVTWSGVRSPEADADRRPWNGLSVAEQQTVLEHERNWGRADDTRGLGQMLHVIAEAV